MKVYYVVAVIDQKESADPLSGTRADLIAQPT
jgi:hypothetical protein